MSYVEQITLAIAGFVSALIPTYTKSKYVWDTSLNSDSKTKTYYAIRPSTAQFISGTCGTVTVEQDFTVEIGDSFRSKADSDSDADGKIYAIYQAHETLYLSLVRNNFGIPRVQVVSSFRLSEPEIDNENKSVKIESIFTVKYRME